MVGGEGSDHHGPGRWSTRISDVHTSIDTDTASNQ